MKRMKPILTDFYDNLQLSFRGVFDEESSHCVKGKIPRSEDFARNDRTKCLFVDTPSMYIKKSFASFADHSLPITSTTPGNTTRSAPSASVRRVPVVGSYRPTAICAGPV